MIAYPSMRRPVTILLALALAACGTDTQTTGGGTTAGGDTSAGDTTSGDTSAGDTTGGDTTAGDTTGAETTGGGTTGVDTAGGAAWTEDCPADTPEYRMVNVGQVSLNVACQGSGPTVVLLHGFPEFSLAWQKLMDELAADYRLIVPDQRGYNLSDKPEGVENYTIDKLVADVAGLIDHVSDEPVALLGHDWGGAVAWVVGNQLTTRVNKLMIANGPHPDVFARELANNPDQQEASSYINALLTPGSETFMAANDYALLASAFAGSLSDEELVLYKAAWGQEGALLGMVNWYRANITEAGTFDGENVTVDTPTLVMWGMKDAALLAGNLVGLEEFVSDLTVVEFADATHWIGHEQPKELARVMKEWLNGGVPTPPEPMDTTDPDPDPDPDPEEPPEIPDGTQGNAAEYLPLPAFSNVTDHKDVGVTPADFMGHWTVMWFYPAANTFG